VVKNFTQLTPVHTCVAPMTGFDGTTVSSYGQASARTRAFIGLDVAVTTDANPGSPPREAPV
jgi:hypothetical protein